MKLSLRSEYALLSLIHIAREANSGTTPDEIAYSLKIPSETLQELLRQYRKIFIYFLWRDIHRN